MFRRIIAAAIALSATACGSNGGSVYDQPLPKSDDVEAMNKIKEGVKPEDADAWQGVTMMLIMPTAKRPTSATVGEAITRFKAREACTSKNDVSKGPQYGEPGYSMERYNATVAAYNDCLKMPA